jgi:hypothetical protein
LRVGVPKTVSLLLVPASVVEPIEVFPALSITKLVFVDEPTANAGPEIPFGFTESWAHGVVVPMPTFPLAFTMN